MLTYNYIAIFTFPIELSIYKMQITSKPKSIRSFKQIIFENSNKSSTVNTKV